MRAALRHGLPSMMFASMLFASSLAQASWWHHKTAGASAAYSAMPGAAFVSVPTASFSAMPQAAFSAGCYTTSYVAPSAAVLTALPTTSYVAAPSFSGLTVSPLASAFQPAGFVSPSFSSLQNLATLSMLNSGSSGLSYAGASLAAQNAANLAAAQASVYSAALSNASFADASLAQAAATQYGSIAAAAERRGVNGGRFVLLLKNIFGGFKNLFPGEVGGRSTVRDLLVGLIGELLGINPIGSGLGSDIEDLLNELLGGGSGQGQGGGRTYTIHVRVENGQGSDPIDDMFGGGGGQDDRFDQFFSSVGPMHAALSQAMPSIQGHGAQQGAAAAAGNPSDSLNQKIDELIQALKEFQGGQ